MARAILSDATINALRRKAPDLSASEPLARWQRLAPFAVVVSVTALVGVWPKAASNAIAVTLALPFLSVVLLRAAAILSVLFQPRPERQRSTRRARRTRRRAERDLPTYSVMAALYREAAVAPALVRALAALDYPQDKLEIMFLIEEDDAETRSALSAVITLPHMRVVTAPQGLPKTKPRALTYGLQTATGELIAVYDAEDVPQRSQLRVAAAAFAAGDERLACVQARLGLYNPRESWIARGIA
ncbi:MAG: glycosyltransferase [Hyphomicrobium sp.]